MANSTEYGILGLDDLQRRRLEEVKTQVTSLIPESLADQNRVVNAIFDAWVEDTTIEEERIELLPNLKLQPVTSLDRAKPVVADVTNTVAYPLKYGEHAWAIDEETRAKMTVEEFNKEFAKGISADINWNRDHSFSAFLDKGQWTFKDKKRDLTIKPFANGDTDVYVDKTRTPVTANHYLAINAVMSDTPAENPFLLLYNTLRNYPSNNVNDRNPVIAYVSSDLTDDVTNLNGLIEPEDPDIVLQNTSFAKALNLMIGDTYLGKVGRVRVIELASLPSNTVFGWASGAGKFMKRRQFPEAALQGLRYETDWHKKLIEFHYLRRISGYGVFNRVAGAVVQMSTAAYATPAGWEAYKDVVGD